MIDDNGNAGDIIGGQDCSSIPPTTVLPTYCTRMRHTFFPNAFALYPLQQAANQARTNCASVTSTENDRRKYVAYHREHEGGGAEGEGVRQPSQVVK